jgi:hypothetical protein
LRGFDEEVSNACDQRDRTGEESADIAKRWARNDRVITQRSAVNPQTISDKLVTD